MPVVPFQDLPVTDKETFDPGGQGRAAVEDDILGNSNSPDWGRFKKAHLWFDSDNQDKKGGYKLIIARMVNGRLTVIWRQLVAAVAVLNGARGGINVSADEKRAAFNHAMRYYKKMGVPTSDYPEFKGSTSTSLSAPIFMASVDLFRSINPEDLDDSPKWVHVSTEGDYPGYNDGTEPFELTRKDFDDIVRNVHENPSYKAGADGVGEVGVVSWDFHHASEMHPATGMISVVGAPSQAWSMDFEVRDGPKGEAQLWALTEFLELAKDYVRKKQYKWASIAARFNYTNPATGKNVGTYITSIALTNQPIVKGMERLVASENALLNSDGWFVPKMRETLVFPDVSTDEDVLKGVSIFVSQALEKESNAGGQPTEPAMSVSVENTAAAAKAKENKDMELLKTLAGTLGVRESDAEVKAAVEDLVALRAGAKQELSLENDSTRIVLESIRKATNAKERLSAFVKSLGVEDPDAAVEKVAELLGHSKTLTDVMPELKNLRTKVQEQEAASAAKEVEEVIASRSYDPSMRDALLLFRMSEPAKFAERYAVKPEDKPRKQDLIPDVLMNSFVVTPSGVQFRPQVSQQVAMSNPSKDKIQMGADVINLADYPGVNPTERAMSYVRSTIHGADKWTHDQVWTKAMHLKRLPNVVDELG